MSLYVLMNSLIGEIWYWSLYEYVSSHTKKRVFGDICSFLGSLRGFFFFSFVNVLLNIVVIVENSLYWYNYSVNSASEVEI